LLSSALLWRTDPPCTIGKRNGKDDRIATDCKKPRWIARSGEQVAFGPLSFVRHGLPETGMILMSKNFLKKSFENPKVP